MNFLITAGEKYEWTKIKTGKNILPKSLGHWDICPKILSGLFYETRPRYRYRYIEKKLCIFSNSVLQISTTI